MWLPQGGAGPQSRAPPSSGVLSRIGRGTPQVKGQVASWERMGTGRGA